MALMRPEGSLTSEAEAGMGMGVVARRKESCARAGGSGHRLNLRLWLLRALGLWPRGFSKSPSFSYRKGTGSHPPVRTTTLGGT